MGSLVRALEEDAMGPIDDRRAQGKKKGVSGVSRCTAGKGDEDETLLVAGVRGVLRCSMSARWWLRSMISELGYD
jgi:hypothetical protein